MECLEGASHRKTLLHITLINLPKNSAINFHKLLIQCFFNKRTPKYYPEGSSREPLQQRISFRAVLLSTRENTGITASPRANSSLINHLYLFTKPERLPKILKCLWFLLTQYQQIHLLILEQFDTSKLLAFRESNYNGHHIPKNINFFYFYHPLLKIQIIHHFQTLKTQGNSPITNSCGNF